MVATQRPTPLTPPAPAAPTRPREWLTAREVAARLGCSTQAVYAAHHAGRLPAVGIGTRAWRWSRASVDAYATGASGAIAGTSTGAGTTTGPSVADVARVLATGLRRLADDLEGIGQ